MLTGLRVEPAKSVWGQTSSLNVSRYIPEAARAQLLGCGDHCREGAGKLPTVVLRDSLGTQDTCSNDSETLITFSFPHGELPAPSQEYMVRPGFWPCKRCSHPQLPLGLLSTLLP